MAEAADHPEELWNIKHLFRPERAISNDSTTLPSRQHSGSTSPIFESEGDEIVEFELNECPYDPCEDGPLEVSVKATDLDNANGKSAHGPGAERTLETSIHAIAQIQQKRRRLGDVEASMLFCFAVGAYCYCNYSMSIIATICAIAGTRASLTLFPGALLDLRRDFDMVEETHESLREKIENGIATFGLMMYGIAVLYGILSCSTLRLFLGGVAALMLLPGLYLFVFGGCKPEDFDDDCCTRHRTCEEVGGKPESDGKSAYSGVVVVSLAMYGLGFLYGIYSSGTFRLIMGGVAAMMLLPGIYLFKLGGCKPEDFDDDCHTKHEDPKELQTKIKSAGIWASSGAVVFLAMYGLAFTYGVYTSGTFRLIMGGVAAMMLVPGIYLFKLGGCKPEDFDDDCHTKHEEEKSESTDKCACRGVVTVSLAIYGLAFFYCIYTYATFRLIMGGVAAMMLLPGIYLFKLGGCTAEDFDDDCHTKHEEEMAESSNGWLCNGIALVALAMYGVIFLYGVCTSGTFRLIMGGVAAMMMLPGIYLFKLGGCKPEDFDDDCHTMHGNYMEIKETSESGNGWACSGVAFIALSMYGLIFLHGVYTSGTFRLIMGGVAAMMLLPGIYLFKLGGCKPEDFDDDCHTMHGNLNEMEEASDSGNEWACSGVALIALAMYGVIFLYGVYTSGTFRLIMGGVAAMMLLPGIYLFKLGGCRPEDFDDDCHTKHEDPKELQTKIKSAGIWASSGAVVSLAMYGLAFTYGVYTSGTFRLIMGGVAAMMLVPGIYLFKLGGCKPEDFHED